MTLHDGFGAAVSHRDQGQVDLLTQAARLSLAYAPDPEAAIVALLEDAPDFIMARCFLCGMLLVASDKRRQPRLRREFDLLAPLADHANKREAGHIRAIRLWLDGDFYAASQAYADILSEHPRDLIALQFGHQTDFLLGHVSSTRDRPARVARHWSEADPDYSFILGMQAFGLEEAGHYAQAEELALRSVTLNPHDAWGVHALAHCYEMQGKTEAGISFMENHETDWGSNNYLSIHNRWHLSLYYIERLMFDRALEMHDRYMHVGPESALMDAHDSAALLWRLRLDGVDCGTRWEAPALLYEQVLGQAYMPFNDMHAMFSFIATGRDDCADALIRALEANLDGPTTSSFVIKGAGLAIMKGLRAFGCGDFRTAKSLLGAYRHNAHLLGGSIAQRDVLNLTLLSAAEWDRDTAMVESLIAERTLLRPHSPLSDFLIGRNQASVRTVAE
jgi:tetratricopeptide (TPR) repeat protein